MCLCFIWCILSTSCTTCRFQIILLTKLWHKDRTKLWQDIRNTSAAAFEFLFSQNMFLVSNVLLGMANAQLNNILNDELDNFKRVCVLNLHKLWQKYKSATSGMLALGRCWHRFVLMAWCEPMLCWYRINLNSLIYVYIQMSVNPIKELKRWYILYLYPVMLLRFVSVREFTRDRCTCIQLSIEHLAQPYNLYHVYML